MKIDAGKVYQLTGAVMNYAWGGFELIPELLGIDNNEQKPFAEYWMGAHTLAPSQVIENGISLGELKSIFAAQPELLGEKVLQKFCELPYLFKIQEVKDVLSIQVHPTKAEAEKGFADEETRGIPLNAPNRNYKDNNHKPEVAVALSDFWLLHGFKPEAELLQTLQSAPEFNSFISIFNNGDYKVLYSHVMEMPQQQVDELLSPLVKRELQNAGNHAKHEPGYWLARYYGVLDPSKVPDTLSNIDRGIFSMYFFNIVHLKEGQGIFQGAGVPHAYLEGHNAELMSNSDNVLRAGLTPKHIDIPELMKHTKFEAVHPQIMNGEQNGAEKVYHCPVDDFIISKIQLISNESYSSQSQSPEIFICLNGSATVTASNELQIKKGEAFIVFANNNYNIQASANTVLFKAFVPV